MALRELSAQQAIASNLKPTPPFLEWMNQNIRTIRSTLADLATTQDELALAQAAIVAQQETLTEVVATLAVQVERLTRQTISTSYVQGLTLTGEADGPTNAKITISDHVRIYTDGEVVVTGASISGLEYGKTYFAYYDDAGRLGGAVSYAATQVETEAVTSPENPYRHAVGTVSTPATDADPPEMGGGVRPPSLPPGITPPP